ncbi:MAG: cyclic nucleotide-binding domain-containing protein [Magnetococcus sp. THC-1_WYH]
MNIFQTFHDQVNMSGWVSVANFKEIFSGISATEFANHSRYPFLLGESVSNIKVVKAKGASSFKVNNSMASPGRTPLNYLFPLSGSSAEGELDSFTLGSSSQCQFILPDYTISPKHATIYRKGGTCFLKDLGSEFGSFVNSVSFGSKDVALADGDSISIGRYQFIFLEPRTLFEYIFTYSGESNASVILEEDITEERISENNKLRKDLKSELHQSSTYAATCISSGDFTGFDERVLKILSFVPFFNSFSTAEIKQIISFHNRFLSSKKNDFIIRENDKSDAFYIVLKGRVNVVRSSHATPLNSLGPSSTFGEIAFLLGSPRYASVVAQEDTILFGIDRDMFQNIGIEIRVKIKLQIIRQMSAIIHRQNIYLQEQRRQESGSIPRIFGNADDSHVELDTSESIRQSAKRLEKIPLFSGFSKFEMNSLVIAIDKIGKYTDGAIILREGRLNNVFYFILEGSVYVTGAESSTILSTLKQGKFFGEMSVFSKSLVSANIISRGDATIMMIPTDNFHAMPVETREKLLDLVLKQTIDRQSDQNMHMLKYSE